MISLQTIQNACLRKVWRPAVIGREDTPSLPSQHGRHLLFCFDIPDLLSEIRKEENALPGQTELNNALRDLEKSRGIDPAGYRAL